jgi:hypothetical protein
MKGGMIYFGIVTVFMLVVVGIAMYVSDGFQMIQAQYGFMGVVGFITIFILMSVWFMAMVRRSLKKAMEQGGHGKSSAQYDEVDMNQE